MKRSIYLILFMLSGLIILGCSDKPSSPVDRIELGEPFTLDEGQSTIIESEGLEIEFIGVGNEGRCPTGMVCFWEGLAELDIGVKIPGHKGIIVTPGISGGGNGLDYRASAYDYTIIVNALEPYPENPLIMAPYIAPPYLATLTVEKDFHYPQIVTPVIISDSPPDSIQLHDFDLGDMSITGDTLAVTVAYGGGCRRHYFWLYMSPSVFMGSEPVQANLYLRHFNNDDMCEAYITETGYFDLSPIRELYQQMYGQHGSIRLNLFEFFIDQPGDYMDATYSF